MPKIVFVNRFYSPDLSATSQLLSDLTARLSEIGLDVHVICSRQLYEDAHATLPKREQVRGVHVERVWSARFGRGSLIGRAFDYLTFYCVSTLKLIFLLRRADVLVTKTDPPLLSVAGALAAWLRGAILVNWLQDVFPEVAARLGVARAPVLINLLQTLRDRSLNAAETNVVLGSAMRDYLIARGVPRERVRIIENWADGAAVRPARTSVLRDQLGMRDRFVVMYSGNLGRAHEIETLLEAAECLRHEPRFVFLMVGGGSGMRELASAAAARQLESIHFLPYQPREALRDSLAAADVHLVSLLPELEGLIVPSKFYGILAAGRPTIFIGDPSGEIAQTIERERCGLSVTRGDGAALARHLQQLAAEPHTTRAMGERARELFERRFTLELATAKWLDLLCGLGVEGTLVAGQRQFGT